MPTRRGKNKDQGKYQANMDTSGSSGETVAPTAELGARKAAQELQLCKMKMEWQKERLDELVKERDFLKEQLAAALQKDVQAASKPPTEVLKSDSASSSPNKSSLESTVSDTCTSESTDEEVKSHKKKGKERKLKKVKKVKKMKKLKKHKIEQTFRNRAQSPKHVVARYMKSLRFFNRGGTMSAAFQRCNVDRNTIVATAPIVELQFAAPKKYEELEQERPPKLSDFAAKCAAAIADDPVIDNKIKVFKSTGKLLPLKTKAHAP